MVELRAAPEQLQNRPVIYRRPVPLRAETHAETTLRSQSDFGFARGATSVILGAAEYGRIMHHYPIVFSAGDRPAALAVTGIEPDINLFVDAAGTWTPNTYIPAFVRRYPFILMERPDSDELTLCIDEAAELVTREPGRPLFEAGEPSQLVKDVLVFCRDYFNETRASAAFATALAEQKVLVPNTARITLKSGRLLQVTDFQVIDEARFNALPDEIFLDWRRRGWLALVYAHLLSAANWANLVETAAAGEAPAA